MVKYFKREHSLDIILEPPLVSDDNVVLKSILELHYNQVNIEFGHVYSVDDQMIKILNDELNVKHKNIKIITHKYKLDRYFHKLGFKTKFISLLGSKLVHIDSIDMILIGGSANSSTKIMEFVKNITLENSTLVCVQHVEPDKKGLFDNILQKYTKYKVSYANDGEKIEKNRIYLARNNKHLKVDNGHFVLSDEDRYNYAKPSVSLSYESFSSYYKESLLVIQECGYASDGVDKLEYLKSQGSTLIVQNVDECEAKPMVTGALAVGVHDYVLKEEDISLYLNLVDTRLDYKGWIVYLLEHIHTRYGYDFKLYNRGMLNRRLDVFMLKHDIHNIKDCVCLILFNKNAFKGFFLEVSINVTELFRETESLNHIIGFLKKNYLNAHSIKIWSAGCSSGEEVYSVAILLKILGLLKKTTIYATDFNKVILQEAKNALYSNESYVLANDNFAKIELDDNLDNYFVKYDSFVGMTDEIKEKVLFFNHNLAVDSSFNEFDIIMCRNVIIYFDDTLQKKVFQLFYESLRFGGHLVLGESERIHLMFETKFQKIDKKNNIYKKVA